MEPSAISGKKRGNIANLKPFTKGVSGNPSGRPKGSLKDFVRRTLAEMTDEEKRKFIRKMDKETVWKMAEGNPTNEVVGELNLKVEKLEEIQKATKDILK